MALGVPVDNAFLDKGHEAVANLLEEVNGLCFGEFGVFGEVLFEVVVTDLLDYVVVVAALHHVEHPHHVF